MRLALFLLPGAIINVAVAWTLAFQQQWPFDGFNLRGTMEIENPNAILVANGVLPMSRLDRLDLQAAGWKPNSINGHLTAMNHNRVGLRTRSILEEMSSGCFFYQWRCSDQITSGWPFLSMHGQRLNRAVEKDDWFISQTQPAWDSVGAIAIPNSGQGVNSWCDVRIMPLMPHKFGFAINTIFYAAILWLLFAFPFALRRRRRIKRGLCPACAYPVGASAVCTECGRAV